MLKVAILGIGGISGAHIPAWQNMENAEIVALCDIRPEQMKKYQMFRRYTSFDDLLEKEQIDILDICLPTYLHVEYAVKAMERGIHVLCEKPLSLNAQDVVKVYGAAKRNHVKFMVAQVLRFWPEYDYVKNIYDLGTYGKLLSGTMSRLEQCPAWSEGGWMRDENRSGLVPFDLHIHDLDFLVHAFGAPKSAVPFRVKRPEQDYLNVTYQFDDFFVNTEAAWYAAAYPFKAEFRFQFEKAVVAMENGKLKVYEADGKMLDVTPGTIGDTGEIHLPQSNAYANEIAYFAKCVENDTWPEKVKAEELETVIRLLRE